MDVRDFTYKNRDFNYVGLAPHITRDGRNIHLHCWSVECSHPDCRTPIIVRTATATPAGWRNFDPARYCHPHRREARRLAGKMAAQRLSRGAPRTGPVAAVILSGVAEKKPPGMAWHELRELATERLTHTPGTQDLRIYRVRRAAERLVAQRRLLVIAGKLYPPNVITVDLVGDAPAHADPTGGASAP